MYHALLAKWGAARDAIEEAVCMERRRGVGGGGELQGEGGEVFQYCDAASRESPLKMSLSRYN